QRFRRPFREERIEHTIQVPARDESLPRTVVDALRLPPLGRGQEWPARDLTEAHVLGEAVEEVDAQLEHRAPERFLVDDPIPFAPRALLRVVDVAGRD